MSDENPYRSPLIADQPRPVPDWRWRVYILAHAVFVALGGAMFFILVLEERSLAYPLKVPAPVAVPLSVGSCGFLLVAPVADLYLVLLAVRSRPMYLKLAALDSALTLAHLAFALLPAVSL